jgi:hypothetical protein
MTKIKSPTEAELRAMIAEAKRTVTDLEASIRSALLEGAPTGGIRDQLADAKSRIARWEAALQEIEDHVAKVAVDRVAALGLEIGVAAVAKVTELLATLQPPPFPAAQVQGVSQ